MDGATGVDEGFTDVMTAGPSNNHQIQGVALYHANEANKFYKYQGRGLCTTKEGTFGEVPVDII